MLTQQEQQLEDIELRKLSIEASIKINTSNGTFTITEDVFIDAERIFNWIKDGKE